MPEAKLVKTPWKWKGDLVFMLRRKFNKFGLEFEWIGAKIRRFWPKARPSIADSVVRRAGAILEINRQRSWERPSLSLSCLSQQLCQRWLLGVMM